ncbi:MAG: hypothetical protein HAW59_05145 [Betaproteobacteria bacterium]|nr:hypothetical protein [Betaproteobacteria bacterium]
MPAARAELRKRIAARLDAMFAAGLIAETKTVISEFNLHSDSPPLRMAGYRQAAACLRGECGEAEAKLRAYYATCQLAKRQMTWLRNWREKPEYTDPFAAAAEKKITAAAKNILRN